MSDIGDILSELKQGADPVQTIKTVVLTEGGVWYNPEVASGIVEIQVAGLVGIGPSVETAVDDWIVQAQAAANSDPAANTELARSA
jgi:hypothetical protein